MTMPAAVEQTFHDIGGGYVTTNPDHPALHLVADGDAPKYMREVRVSQHPIKEGLSEILTSMYNTSCVYAYTTYTDSMTYNGQAVLVVIETGPAGRPLVELPAIEVTD